VYIQTGIKGEVSLVAQGVELCNLESNACQATNRHYVIEIIVVVVVIIIIKIVHSD